MARDICCRYLFVALVGCDASYPKRVCQCSSSVDDFGTVSSRPCVLPVSISSDSIDVAGGFTSGPLASVGGMAVDHDGSVLMTETDLHRVVRLRLSEELPSGANVVASAALRQVSVAIQTRLYSGDEMKYMLTGRFLHIRRACTNA